MRLTKSDLELIEEATKVVKDNSDIYNNPAYHVGCVLRAKSGKLYKGVNIRTSHSVCAEQVAIGQALACGEREFDTLVSVKMDSKGDCRVVSPCGVCRYIFDKLNLDFDVILEDIENNTVIRVAESKLLPYPYKRDPIENQKNHHKKNTALMNE